MGNPYTRHLGFFNRMFAGSCILHTLLVRAQFLDCASSQSCEARTFRVGQHADGALSDKSVYFHSYMSTMTPHGVCFASQCCCIPFPVPCTTEFPTGQD